MNTEVDTGYESARASAWDQHHAARASEAMQRQVAPPENELELSVPLEVLTEEQQERARRWTRDEALARRAGEQLHKNAWKRLDLLLVRLVCEPGAFRKMLSQAYSFALAHALGYVSKSTRQERLLRCSECTFKKQAKLPLLGDVEHCHGENGGSGCGCAQHPLWPFSTLGYKSSLANYRCPIGKFRRRWFDRVNLTGWRDTRQDWAPWWSWIGYGLAAGIAGVIAWMALWLGRIVL